MTWLIVLGVVLCVGFLVWSVRQVATNEMPDEPWCDEHNFGPVDLQKGRRFLICRICGYIEDKEAEHEKVSMV